MSDFFDLPDDPPEELDALPTVSDTLAQLVIQGLPAAVVDLLGSPAFPRGDDEVVGLVVDVDPETGAAVVLVDCERAPAEPETYCVEIRVDAQGRVSTVHETP